MSVSPDPKYNAPNSKHCFVNGQGRYRKRIAEHFMLIISTPNLTLEEFQDGRS